jgi:hypothetical protein
VLGIPGSGGHALGSGTFRVLAVAGIMSTEASQQLLNDEDESTEQIASDSPTSSLDLRRYEEPIHSHFLWYTDPSVLSSLSSQEKKGHIKSVELPHFNLTVSVVCNLSCSASANLMPICGFQVSCKKAAEESTWCHIFDCMLHSCRTGSHARCRRYNTFTSVPCNSEKQFRGHHMQRSFKSCNTL